MWASTSITGNPASLAGVPGEHHPWCRHVHWTRQGEESSLFVSSRVVFVANSKSLSLQRKTVTAMDVVYALKRQGKPIYGFGVGPHCGRWLDQCAVRLLSPSCSWMMSKANGANIKRFTISNVEVYLAVYSMFGQSKVMMLSECWARLELIDLL